MSKDFSSCFVFSYFHVPSIGSLEFLCASLFSLHLVEEGPGLRVPKRPGTAGLHEAAPGRR
jgi:hypothetical protein